MVEPVSETAQRPAATAVAPPSPKFVVYAALIGNLLVAIAKALAAAWTGSAALLSEAIHSTVDTGNQVLLLYGMHRAARTASTFSETVRPRFIGNQRTAS